MQGVCQVREVREKSGNLLYPLKSQGKVREFSDKSGKSQGISVKLGDLFLRRANGRKSIKILINFKHFGFYEERKHGKGKKKCRWRVGRGN